jgi:hypothetical protein
LTLQYVYLQSGTSTYHLYHPHNINKSTGIVRRDHSKPALPLTLLRIPDRSSSFPTCNKHEAQSLAAPQKP